MNRLETVPFSVKGASAGRLTDSVKRLLVTVSVAGLIAGADGVRGALPGIPPAGVANAAEVLDVRVGRHPDRTRIVFDVAAPVRYGYRYGAAHELLIALEGGAPGGPEFSGAAGLVEGLRRADPDGRRYIASLRGPAKVDRIFYLPPADAGTSGAAPYRLVIDLVEVPRSEWSALVASTTPRRSDPAPASETEPAPERTPARLETPTPETAYSAGPAGSGPADSEDADHDSQRETPPPVALSADDNLFDGFSMGGYVQVEGRAYTQSSREDGPRRQSASVALAPRFDYTWGGGRQFVSFAPFARIDSNDSNRTHVDIRELKWVGAFDRLEFSIGIDTVFWGVAESWHLVNIINQIDFVEDIRREEMLGQPMAVASWDSPAGLFSFYAMTHHRDRKFPGPDGRPRGPLLVDTRQAFYESDHDKWRFDWAARWSHHIGPVDVALSHFSGTARDPVFVPGVNADGDPVLIPRYDLIDQTSVEFQATFDALLLKFEGLRRWQPGQNFYSAVGGFEYTVFNAFGQSDIGFLMEYLWDQRGGRPDMPFDNDLFAGLRWSANDMAGTTFLAGSIFDLDSSAKFVNVEARRRFGNHWSMSLDARLLIGLPESDPFHPFGDDDFIQLRLERHF